MFYILLALSQTMLGFWGLVTLVAIPKAALFSRNGEPAGSTKCYFKDGR